MYAEELDRYTHWGLLMGCEPEPSQPASQLATAILPTAFPLNIIKGQANWTCVLIQNIYIALTSFKN